MKAGTKVEYYPTEKQLKSLPTEETPLKALVLQDENEDGEHLIRLDEAFSLMRISGVEEGTKEGQMSAVEEDKVEEENSKEEDSKKEDSKEEDSKEEDSKEEDSKEEDSKEKGDKKKDKVPGGGKRK